MDGLDLSADVPMDVGLQDVIARESVRNAKQASLVRSVIKDVPLIVTIRNVTERVENVYHVNPVGMVKTVNVLVSALWTVV